MNRSVLIRAMMVTVLLAMMALIVSALAAQDASGPPATTTARPVQNGFPQGDIHDSTPAFSFIYNPAPDPEITYFNIEIFDDSNNSLQSFWYEIAEACDLDMGILNCIADPEFMLFSGIGDASYEWILRDYNENTQAITEQGTYEFTLTAPGITGPTTFGDLTGSPEFEFTLNPENSITQYEMYVLDDSNNVVVYEIVPEATESCDADSCLTTAAPIGAPLYDDGTYTAYARAIGYGTIDEISYSPWSQPFPFTVNYTTSPENPSAIFNGFVTGEGIVEFFGATQFSGYICEPPVGPDDPFICPNNDISALFIIQDHGFQLPAPLPAVPAEMLATAENTQDTYPIFNATQWFNIKVTDDNNADAEVFNEWINTYENPFCLNQYAFDGLRQQRAEDGRGICVISLPDLAAGDYTLTWMTYNPGGTPSDTFDLIVETASAPLDVETAVTMDQSEVVSFVNEVGLSLIWEDENFLPLWVHIIIRDASDGNIAYENWLQASDEIYFFINFYNDLAELTIEELEALNEYEVFADNLFCEPGQCFVEFLDWNIVNGEYELTVETWTGDVVSGESDPVAFSVQNDAPVIQTESINVMRMFDVEGNTSPTFEWIATNNAAWHHIIIEDDQSNVIIDDWFRWYIACNDFDPEIILQEDELHCQYSPDVILEPGDYTFRVQAWSSGGIGAFSADQTLTIANTALTDPVVVSPNNLEGPYTASPEFIFEPSTNGSWYQILIVDSDDDAEVYNNWVFVPVSECDPGNTDQCVVDLNEEEYGTFELLSGDFTWQVRGANAAGLSDWTTPESFTVDSSESGPLPVWPSENYHIEDVAFYWEAQPTNEWYNLLLWEVDFDTFGGSPDRDNLGEPTINLWFNQDDLGAFCDVPVFYTLIREAAPEASRDVPIPVALPLFYCTHTIADADLPVAEYYWAVDAWGPTYGNEVKINEDFGFFVKN